MATAATTIGGVARAWRRAAASQGKGRHAQGRELRRAREPYRRLDESKPMEDEGVGHRDTLVAMRAPAGVATVAEREAAAAEEDGSEDEEARVASASDSGDSESGQGEDSDAAPSCQSCSMYVEIPQAALLLELLVRLRFLLLLLNAIEHWVAAAVHHRLPILASGHERSTCTAVHALPAATRWQSQPSSLASATYLFASAARAEWP